MHIHHLNCATLRPFAFVLSDTATLTTFAHLVVHCLLVETNDGLVLVDCGFGIADRVRPTPLEHAFMTASRSSRDLAEAAARQVVSLGYASEDVRHIVQTHLHVDHAACFRMRRDCVPCSTTTKMRSSYSVPMIQMN